MSHTLVSFHAHPDDEVLLTGGTLARAAVEGHRVVLVVATDGAAGLADESIRGRLAEVRAAELRASAAALGCARVVLLGYEDSGMDGNRPGPHTFTRADPEQAAARLAAVLTEEAADVLTTYDPAGGYGHPDHRQVHVVGARAAELAGTPVVLEATVDRTWMRRLARLVSVVPGGLGGIRPEAFTDAFSAREDITHRVDVRAHLAAKRAAFRAHASQTGGGGPRTISMLLALPGPVFRLVLGREWFVQRGRPLGPPSGDIFDGAPREGRSPA